MRCPASLRRPTAAGRRREDFLAPLNAQQRVAVEHGTGTERPTRMVRCWSLPAPVPARPTRSPTASRISCEAAPIRSASCSSRFRGERRRKWSAGRGNCCSERCGAATRQRTRRAAMGGHVPQRRRAAPARIRRAHRIARVVLDSRPRRRRGSHRDRAARAWCGRHEAQVSDQGHLPRDLFARRQQRSGADRGPRARLSLVRSVGSGAQEALQRLRAREAGAERPRLRRPAAVLVAHGRRTLAGAGRSASASTTCSSTSIRTPTGCRRRSCWR